jgi:hypothetical protein
MTNQNVPTYLVQSILVTLFCCLPLGIFAMIKSAETSAKLREGDHQGALAASNQTKTICRWSFGVGLIFFLIYCFFIILAVISRG